MMLETPDKRSETFLHPESLQIFRFTSSLFSSPLSSTGFRSENTWHEIRDHSFIQNHSRSSDSQLLLFSSPHSSSTGFSQRTPHEIRDHSFIQNHSRSSDSQLLLFSSPHSSSTGFSQRTPDTDQRPFLHPESLQIFRFTASLFSSPHSSSTGFRSENTWHEIRDHSFIQNHSRSSDSQLLLFSSLTHLLQGSVQRTPDTRSETIPSSRSLQIFRFTASSLQFTHSSSTGFSQRTPDTRSETIPSSRITPDLQIHSFFSSVHLTHLLQGSGQRHLTRDQRPFLHPESLQISDTASSLQFTHSSSTGFRSENTWHEIRDHSFIQNHSRSSDSQLLLSSVHTHLFYRVQVREPWHEIRDHSFTQNHSRSSDSQLFSSVHSLIFYRVQFREHLTRDQRPFLHPESLQIFRFTASPLQFTPLIFYRVQVKNTWHEIRDHSFIQNHSRSSDSQHLLFSSLIHLLQGSDQRTPDTDQRPFLHPESLQIFRFTASSLQFTSLIFYTGFDQRTPDRDQRSFLHPESLQIFRFTSSSLQFTSLIFYRVQVREHLTRDHRPFLHPESLQIFRFTASLSQFTHSSSQGSGQRTPDTRSETIPSSESLQIRFTASPLQFTSLIFYRVQVREHLTRDQRPFLHPESLQIFRFTASPLQFTSLIFYRVHQRTPDTRSETIPSSRITPDLQIHRFSSSVHLTHLLQGSGQITPDPRSETIPSSRITPDLLQIPHLLFSSPHSSSTGSDQRTPDTSSETIPSSRITLDQIHSFSSSVHSLIFYRSVDNTWPEIRDLPSSRIPQIFRFTASSLQFTSLIFYRVQVKNTWHEIRDRSFIQNHSRSSEPLLLFSSLTHFIFYRFRSENTWHESRPFLHPESLQIFDSQLLLFSSLTHLLQVQVRDWDAKAEAWVCAQWSILCYAIF